MNSESQSGQGLERNYWCFISYRHADNKDEGRQWASWLHQQLETYEVPSDLVGSKNERGDEIPSRIFPVFRDEEELGVGSLTEKIFKALDHSKTLVVLCSPRVMESTYVRDEIRYFKKIGKAGHVYAALLDGEPGVTFPDTLRCQVDSSGNVLTDQTEEPLAANFRLADGTQGWTSPEAYSQELKKHQGLSKAGIEKRVADYAKHQEHAKLQLIAGVLGVPLDLLRKRDKAHQLAQAEKRARTLRRWLGVVGLLAVMAGVGGWLAVEKGREATKERDLARHSEGLALLSKAETVEKLGNRHPESLLYAAKAVGFEGWGKEKSEPEGNDLISWLQDLLQRSKGIGDVSESFPRLLNPTLGPAYERAQEWLRTKPPYLPVWNSPGSASAATGVDVSVDGRFIAASFADGGVRIWDLKDGSANTIQEPGSGHAIRQVRFSPDGRWIAGAGEDSAVRLWDAQTREARDPLKGHAMPVHAIAFTHDGTLLASGSADGEILLWTVVTGERKASLKDEEKKPKPVTALAFSPLKPRFDSDTDAVRYEFTLASGSDDGTITVWTIAGDGKAEPTILGQRGTGVAALAFSPGGTFLLSGSADNRVMLWDAARNDFLALRSTHQGPVRDVAFRPDGRAFASASSDGTVQLWDLEAFQDPLQGVTATLSGHAPKTGVTGVAFSPDGQTLASAGEDGGVKLWNVGGLKTPGELLAYLDKGWYGFDPQTQDLQATRMSGEAGAFLNVPEGSMVALWRKDATKEAQWAAILETGNWRRGLDLVRTVEQGGDAGRTKQILSMVAAALRTRRADGQKDYGDSWAEWELEKRLRAAGLTGEAFAPSVEKPAPFTNHAGIEFVWIEPGNFKRELYEGKTQKVTLTKGFWMARHELTQAQWTEVMGNNPSYFPGAGAYAPVEWVSWNDVMDPKDGFCSKLNATAKQKGQLPLGWEYTLPTEAQWEYACRAGTTTVFSFGDILNGVQANCDGTNPEGTAETGPYLKRAVRTGSYPVNPWGLYDMHGNVAEWCYDWYENYPDGDLSDPVVVSKDQAGLRVPRGGSWSDYAGDCRSAKRYGWFPDYRDVLGFRPVLSVVRPETGAEPSAP